MVQELPKKRKSVLVIVTNHATYVLTHPRGPVCTVCESWKLCPTGPRFLRRLPHYKVDKLLLDFSAAHGAGHRFKLEVTDKAKASKGPLDFQFSSLHVGVAQRMLAAIHRVHPRSLQPTLDSALPRIIRLIQQENAGKGEDETETSVLLVLRCEREDKTAKDPGPRLLVIIEHAQHEHSLNLYYEQPEYFGLTPWSDLQSADDIEQPNGRELLQQELSIDIAELSSLDMIMSAEPQVVIEPDSGGKVTLTFADDAAAGLFRQRMREVLWGHGQTSWNDSSKMVKS